MGTRFSMEGVDNGGPVTVVVEDEMGKHDGTYINAEACVGDFGSKPRVGFPFEG